MLGTVLLLDVKTMTAASQHTREYYYIILQGLCANFSVTDSDTAALKLSTAFGSFYRVTHQVA